MTRNESVLSVKAPEAEPEKKLIKPVVKPKIEENIDNLQEI